MLLHWCVGLAIVAGFIFHWEWRKRRCKKLWLSGRTALEAGDADAAEISLRKLVRFVPSGAMVHSLLGIALAQQGRCKEAEERFRLAVALEPRQGWHYYQLGHFLALSPPGRPDEAIDAIEKAIEHDPDLREALVRCESLKMLHGYDRFRRLTGLSPGDE